MTGENDPSMLTLALFLFPLITEHRINLMPFLERHLKAYLPMHIFEGHFK